MSKFAIVATIECAQGQRDELLSSLKAHKERCLRDEPGTVQFEILLPKEDDTKVLSFEVYADDAAFERHHNGRSLARWRKESAGMFVKFTVTRCSLME